MKKLLLFIFLILFIQTAFGQTNPLADEVRVQGLKDTLETRIDSVISAIGTIGGSTDTRIDSLIAALNAVESAADTRIDSILANSLPALNTRTDSLIAVVSADKDSTTSHNDRINALLDTAKVHQDTLASHNDRILALLDSVNNHYSQAILDILLAAKFDKADTTDYYTDAMIDALLAYKFDKSDTSSYYKAVYLDALLSYYFLKSDTTDYYKDVMVDALLGYKLNITDTSYQVQDSYLTALLPYYYVRTDTSSATLGFYPRNMIDAKIAEITGTGVITLNGLSGVTQTLAIDTTISGAPAWSSVGTTHTLQLPFSRFLFWKDTSDIVMPWELGAYSLSTHNHSGVYQAADGDLDTYAGITPSADMQILLTYNISQILAYLSAPTNSAVADSLQDMREALALKADLSNLLKIDTTGAVDYGENNLVYLNTTKDTLKIKSFNPDSSGYPVAGSNITVEKVAGTNAWQISSTGGITSTNLSDTARALYYELTDVSAVDFVAKSGDTLTGTWICPVIKPDSIIVTWNTTGYVDSDEQTNRHAYAGDRNADTLSSLVDGTVYYINVFKKDYRGVIGTNSSWTRDLCSTSAGDVAIVDSSNDTYTPNEVTHIAKIPINVSDVSNRYISVVVVQPAAGGVAYMTLNTGGTTVAQIDSNANYKLIVYGLVAPTVGDDTLIVYCTGGDAIQADVRVFKNVNQDTPRGTIAQAYEAYGKTATCNITSMGEQDYGISYARISATGVTAGSPMILSTNPDSEYLYVGVTTYVDGTEPTTWNSVGDGSFSIISFNVKKVE